MDLQTMRNMVLYWLDDLQGAYFTSVQVNLWLNNAQREVQKLLLQAGENFYVTKVQTTLVVNQQEYVLPSDFIWLHRLEIVLSGTAPNEEITSIGPITLNQQDMFQGGTGTPAAYYIKKNRLVLWPNTDTAYVMRMDYSPVVVDMANNTDVPDVPTEYQEMLPILATIDGYIKDDRDPATFMAKKAFYETMMKQTSQRRTMDAPRSVVVTKNDLVGTLF